VASPLERAAAAGIHRLAIPTPFLVGAVNTYLIEDDPLTLFDSGPNSGKSLDALDRALAEHGRKVEDLELLVVSHQHMDHLGLVDILQARSGAEVASLDALAPWMGDYADRMAADDVFAEDIMRRHGVPGEVATALRAVSHAFRGWGAGATVTRPLAPDSDLVLRDRTLRVLHRPGHSPSDTVFHDAERGIMLGGDHLIGHISSNPLITKPLDGSGSAVDRPKALLTYMDSLLATQAMEDVEIILPGHGDPVTDHVGLVTERFRMHEKRATKILAFLAEQPMTAHQVAHAMWGNVAVTQAYLTLSEVLGHLDVLEQRGEIVEDVQDGVARFAPS
jgi:glyoxylase-like metal-dependent hydrolase (beta-lactamase superfamily II)